MGAPANGAGLCWKDRAAQGRDGSFCGAHRQAGQLACPEDTLEQLCRLPKAIWLTRTYLAHQVTIMSARLPQPTLSVPAKTPNSTLQLLLSFC